MKDMMFSMEEIFLGSQLYKDISKQKNVQSNKKVTSTSNKIVDPEKESIYKFNADDVNGDAIESIFSWNIQQKRIPNIWKRAVV